MSGAAVLGGVLMLLAAPANAQASSDVRTIPPIPGVRIEAFGQVVETDQQGVAKFEEAVALSSSALTVVDEVLTLPGGRRARYDKTRSTPTGYAAAFDIDYRVTFDAATVGGERIDPSRTSDIMLRSALTGQRRSVRAGGAVWLHGTRVVAELGVPQSRDVPWTVQRFEVDGKQVVSQGQQRVVPAELPAEDRAVVVEARLFTAEFTARDAMLGSPTGTELLLQHPDGQATSHPLGGDGTVRVPDLVPGTYEVAVSGSGPLMSRPVALSRDQEIELDVYSWWDLCIVVLVSIFFFAGLAELGRRRARAEEAPVTTGRVPAGMSGQVNGQISKGRG